MPLTEPMSQSPSLTHRSPQGSRWTLGQHPWSWRRAISLGLCFGVGYGLTLRLLNLPEGEGWRGVQRFGVKSFPGTELDSLRRQFGDRQQEIRGDLDLLELERQQKRNAAELSRRQAEMAVREQQEREQQQSQEQRQRLDSLPKEEPESLPPLPAAPAERPAPVDSEPVIFTPSPPSLPAPAPPSAPAAEAPPAASPPPTP